MTRHNPWHNPQIRVPKPRITHRRLESVTPGHNPLVQNPLTGVLCPGVYVRQSWNLAFRTPFPVTENDIIHCVLILQGVMSWGFRPTLPLTGGSDPGGLCPPIVVHGALESATVLWRLRNHCNIIVDNTFRDYCYADLAVSSLAISSTHCAYPLRDGPGGWLYTKMLYPYTRKWSPIPFNNNNIIIIIIIIIIIRVWVRLTDDTARGIHGDVWRQWLWNELRVEDVWLHGEGLSTTCCCSR